MNKKFTLRPFFAVEYAGIYLIQDSEFYDGHNLLDNDNFPDQAEYNAKLMAAAPDILSALNECIYALKYAAFNYDGSKLENLQDGIIESTGVSNTCLIAVRNSLVAIKKATE